MTFVSARGSYASVVTNFRGTRAGCIATAVPGSYTGASIAFGVAEDAKLRRQGLETLCPVFTLRFEGPTTVRVTAGAHYSRQHAVAAHIPLRAMDFGAAQFRRSDIKGVRLGPVLNKAELGPLPSVSSGQDASKYFRRKMEKRGYYFTNVQGNAAAAQVTGWPWDVLYDAHYLREFKAMVTSAGFREAVLRQYGTPSSERPQNGYMIWLYDLDGRQVTKDTPPDNSCRRTADFWLKYDADNVIAGINWNSNSDDFGPWGCSVLMEINPNHGDGGVTGYYIRIASGYAMALNHFFQRLAQPVAVMKKIQAFKGYKPKVQ